jgi:hypothetical protein
MRFESILPTFSACCLRGQIFILDFDDLFGLSGLFGLFGDMIHCLNRSAAFAKKLRQAKEPRTGNQSRKPGLEVIASQWNVRPSSTFIYMVFKILINSTFVNPIWSMMESKLPGGISSR